MASHRKFNVRSKRCKLKLNLKFLPQPILYLWHVATKYLSIHDRRAALISKNNWLSSETMIIFRIQINLGNSQEGLIQAIIMNGQDTDP